MKQIIITLILLFCIPSLLYADEPWEPYNPDEKNDLQFAKKEFKFYNRHVSIVKKKGKYGLKWKGGYGGRNKWIIPCEYDAFFYSLDNSNLQFRTASKMACYNVVYNKVLPKEYFNADGIICNLYFSPKKRNQLQVIQYTSNGPVGLYDLIEEEEVVPAQYDHIWLIETGYQESTSYVLLKKDNEYTVYDWVNKKALSSFQYDNDLTYLELGDWSPLTIIKHFKDHCLDWKSVLNAEEVYKWLIEKEKTLSAFQYDNDLTRYYRKSLDYVRMLKDTYIITSRPRGYELYNWRKKEVALPASNNYEVVYDSNFLSDRIIKVHTKGQRNLYGYYDLYEKKEIAPPCYKDIQKTSNSRYLWVSKTKKINTSASNPASLYDITSQQEINLSSYSTIKFVKGKNMLWVKKGELWGVYDLVKKAEIIPTKFNNIESISETNHFLCKLTNSHAIYNESGKELIPASRGYINIEFQKNQNKFEYRTGRYYGECDRYGNELSRKEIVTFESTWTSTTDNAISFHISNVSIQQLLGHEIEAICWISDANRKPLKDTNNKYHTSTGYVSTGRTYEVAYSNSIIKQVTLEIPKNEFHLDRNREHRLLYNIGFYDKTDKKMIREFGYIYSFTLDKAQAVNSQVSSSSKKSNQSNNKTVSKPGLLCSGTIYVSSQGYNLTTGQYFGGGPDAIYGIEIYNDYIIVGTSRYNYSRNTDNGSERVYEGTNGLGDMCYYYVNPNTFAMRLVMQFSNPYTGGFDYASYQISNGPTMLQYNNPTYNPSGGNNNSGNSGGNSNTNRNNNKQRRECSLCHGKRRIVRDSPIPVYGNDSRVRCNECGGYFMRSTGHSHVTCTQCHGNGYVEY